MVDTILPQNQPRPQVTNFLQRFRELTNPPGGEKPLLRINQDDSLIEGFGKEAVNFLAAGAGMPRRAAGQAVGLLGNASQSIADMFTPKNQLDLALGNKSLLPARDGIARDELQQAFQQATQPEASGPRTVNRMNIGSITPLPDLPMQPVPDAPDFTAAEQLLQESAEQGEFDSQGNLVSGLLQGLASADTSTDDVGQLLLNLGLAAAGGVGAGKAANRREKQQRAEQAAQDKRRQAEFETEKELMRVEAANEASRIAYENAIANRALQVQRAEQFKPKVLDTNAYGVMLQTVDPETGEISITTQPSGILSQAMNARKTLKGLGADQATLDAASTEIFLQSGSPAAPYQAMAFDLINGGMTQQVLSPEQEEKLSERINTKVQEAQFSGITDSDLLARVAMEERVNFLMGLMMEHEPTLKRVMNLTNTGAKLRNAGN